MHPTRNYFQEFKGDCEVFVETGSYIGDGVTLAVQAGFTEIHSIDIKKFVPDNYKHEMNNYHFYLGDSAEVLKTLLPALKGKRLFMWLDAHSQMMEGEEENYPLMRELEVIKESGINDATILIDDFLFMSHPLITRLDYSDIELMIALINPNYKTEYLPNPIIKNILLARL